MLKLDGKPFTTKVIAPTVSKLKEFLDNSPPDEIYSRKEMANRGFSKDSMDRLLPHFPENSRLWKGKRYFGSLKALEAFDGEVA